MVPTAGRGGSTLKQMRPGWDDAERAALVALLRARPDGLTWPEITTEVAETGSAREVWAHRIPTDLFDQSADGHVLLTEAHADIERWAAAPFDFLTFMDAQYPPRLRDVHQIPPVLFSRGHLVQRDVGVCVVGSRKASDFALSLARRISVGLVERSLSVVSGLAEGIDAAAHVAALESGGRTVAVIGTGIERQYPAVNADLQRRIEREGLVISQFWPAAPPTKKSFPMRNAVMSAYGCATIVVEAGETSGARTQARLAVEHGRPVILAQAVVDATGWGRAMVGNPGVSVIGSADEALQAVDRIRETEEKVGQWLALARA